MEKSTIQEVISIHKKQPITYYVKIEKQNRGYSASSYSDRECEDILLSSFKQHKPFPSEDEALKWIINETDEIVENINILDFKRDIMILSTRTNNSRKIVSIVEKDLKSLKRDVEKYFGISIAVSGLIILFVSLLYLFG